MSRRWLVAIGLGVAGLGACDRAPKPPTPNTQPGGMVYEVRGVLKRADPGSGRAVIAHEAIPGYMDAMTMEFAAARPAELVGLHPGDMLAFRLTVTDASSSISQIQKVGHTSIPQDAPTPGLPPPGTVVPDCALVDEQGEALRLSDFKGRAVAITFIFTRCPLPDFCPLMNRHFSTVRKELLAANAGENWHLLSVSIDPEFDTPELLAEYAKGQRADAGHWTFATGEKAQIARLAGLFGLATKAEGAATLEHNLRTVVLDTSGRVQKIFAGNDWKPGELVEEMRRAMNSR